MMDVISEGTPSLLLILSAVKMTICDLLSMARLLYQIERARHFAPSILWMVDERWQGIK